MADIYKVLETGLNEPRWIYLLTFIILLSTTRMALPSGIQRPTQMTIDFYNIITQIKAGQVVLFDGSQPIWNTGMYEATRTTTLRYWYDKGVCVVWILGSTTQAYDLLYCKRVYNIPADQPITSDPNYGKLIVVMPYTWIGTNPYPVAANFRSAGSYDLFGTSFDNLPGISWVKNNQDVACYYGGILGGAYCVAFPRPYTWCIASGCGGSLAVQSNYYGVGLIQGVLIGLKGSAELDQMMGLTNTRSQLGTTAEISIAIWTFALVIIYNIANLVSQRTRKKPLSLIRGY